MLLYQTSAFIRHGEYIKKSYKNNTFKISSPTWMEVFELSDGSYSVSDFDFDYSAFAKFV